MPVTCKCGHRLLRLWLVQGIGLTKEKKLRSYDTAVYKAVATSSAVYKDKVGSSARPHRSHSLPAVPPVSSGAIHTPGTLLLVYKTPPLAKTNVTHQTRSIIGRYWGIIARTTVDFLGLLQT